MFSLGTLLFAQIPMANDDPNANAVPLNPNGTPANNSSTSSNNGGTQSTGNQMQIMNVDTAKVKLPEFLPGNVDLWVWQVECAFKAADIRADAKKYNLIIGQLPSSVIVKLADFRTNPPPAGRMYDDLKAKIIKEYADSETTKIKKLLEDMPLGDRKPSQLLADMRTRAANTPVNDELLRQLWMRNLPETIRAILSTDDTTPLSAKAATADKVLEAMGNGSLRVVNEIQSSKMQQSTQSPGNSDSNDLAAVVASLVSEVKQLRMSQQKQSKSRSSTPVRQNSSNNSKSSGENSSKAKREFEFCWWHYKHGENAQKCKKPCKYFDKNSGN